MICTWTQSGSTTTSRLPDAWNQLICAIRFSNTDNTLAVTLKRFTICLSFHFLKTSEKVEQMMAATVLLQPRVHLACMHACGRTLPLIHMRTWWGELISPMATAPPTSVLCDPKTCSTMPELLLKPFTKIAQQPQYHFNVDFQELIKKAFTQNIYSYWRQRKSQAALNISIWVGLPSQSRISSLLPQQEDKTVVTGRHINNSLVQKPISFKSKSNHRHLLFSASFNFLQ